MPLSTKDNPKEPTVPNEAKFPDGPSANQDPDIDDGLDELDPTKVVGTYAMQPDPNADRPAPLPSVPKGVKKAPADDTPGAKAKVE